MGREKGEGGGKGWRSWASREREGGRKTGSPGPGWGGGTEQVGGGRERAAAAEAAWRRTRVSFLGRDTHRRRGGKGREGRRGTIVARVTCAPPTPMLALIWGPTFYGHPTYFPLLESYYLLHEGAAVPSSVPHFWFMCPKRPTEAQHGQGWMWPSTGGIPGAASCLRALI